MNATEYGDMLTHARSVAARAHGTLAADGGARGTVIETLEPLFAEHETRFPLCVMPLDEPTRASVALAVMAEIIDVFDEARRNADRYDAETASSVMRADAARQQLAVRLGQLWSEFVHVHAEMLNARFGERASTARPAAEVARSLREYAEAAGTDLDEMSTRIFADPAQRRAFWDAGINPDDVARALGR